MDDLRKYISNLRHDFTLQHLDESLVEQDPFLQFEKWLKEATQAQLPEPNAMILSTADKEGRPSGRVLLLRDFSSEGFIFYTNYESRKGKEIAENPFGAMTFFWQQLERQVRIEGKLQKLKEDLSDTYFSGRPRESQIGAWTSPQSKKLKNRNELDELNKKFHEKFKDKEVARPKHWGGYTLVPEKIEFWQGRAGRLHDRLVYQKVENSWQMYRLAP